MQPLLFTLSAAPTLIASLTTRLRAMTGHCESRLFPDGERYLRLDSDVAGRTVILLCGLERPDEKLLQALYFADAAREFGATSVGLVTPYLPYMRQDKRFQPGEALTSRSFATLLSRAFDWLVTVDPHLHRYRELGEIYTIPTRVASAAPALAATLASTFNTTLTAKAASPTPLEDCFLLGPDAESEQWVAAIGRRAGLSWAVARKQRHGDRDVTITLPDLSPMRGKRPIIVDDVISSGTTIRQAANLLRVSGFGAPHCLCVHPLFAENAYEQLLQAGITEIHSCNTITHRSNSIDVAPLIADAIVELLSPI